MFDKYFLAWAVALMTGHVNLVILQSLESPLDMVLAVILNVISIAIFNLIIKLPDEKKN